MSHIRISSSTIILWGISHGAAHPSGTPSGVDSDPGTSNALGIRGRGLEQCLQDWVGYQHCLGGGWGVPSPLSATLPSLSCKVPRYGDKAVVVPWPLVGQPSSDHGLMLLPNVPLSEWCCALRGSRGKSEGY